MAIPDELLSYKPSAFYFRDALRRAKSKDEAIEVGMQVVMELEQLKEFIRGLGMIPPKRHLLLREIEEKEWPLSLESPGQTVFEFSSLRPNGPAPKEQ